MNLAPAPRLPYPGLRSFRREESDLFFGRDESVGAMVDRLAATRFLAVLGSSGTGKSSLVKTGLIDALDLGLLARAGSDWRVVDFTPGAQPMRNLARRLIETETMSAAPDGDVEFLRAFLLRGPRSVAQWAAEGHLPPTQNLLLLVDQFEELFRFQDYAGKEESEAFVGLLIESARLAGARIHVVLTMRSEYLGACSLIDGLAEAIAAGLYLIPRMRRDQCREAILGPATNCGFELEDALVTRLLNDLAAFAPWDDASALGRLERLGRRADQLPLPQYCLNRMYARATQFGAEGRIRLTLADYERIGALGGALDAHANEILNAFGEPRKRTAEKVFRALTEGPTAVAAVRRPTQLGELVEICNGDEAAVRAVVDAYRAPGCNFLMPPPDPAKPAPLPLTAVVDISHESLIRQWKRFPAWLEAETRSLRTWRRLKERFDDGDALQAKELGSVWSWLDEQQPNASWARRYGGDFDAALRFVEDNERRHNRFAPIILACIGLVALTGTGFFSWGASSVLVSAKNATLFVTTFCGGGAIALACAFGLFLYRDFDSRKAMLSGLTIFVVEALANVVSFLASVGLGFDGDGAPVIWLLVLSGPLAIASMAIFDSDFRRLSRWLPLVASWPVLFPLTVATDPFGGGLVVFTLVALWCLWCALLGFLLGRRQTRTVPRFANQRPLQ